MKQFFKALTQNLILLIFVVAIVAAANALSAKMNKRWDLTDEKEYTLSTPMKKILSGLEDRVTVTLYYSKELPPQVLPTKERINDILEEVRAHAAKPIVIEYADPNSNPDKERETNQLGITPMSIRTLEQGKYEQVNIYLGMTIKYKDRQTVIPELILANNVRGVQSIDLEYALSLNLLRMTEKELPRIGLILPEGEDEEPKYQALPQIVGQMGEPVVLNAQNKNIAGLDLKAIIIVEPRDMDPNLVIELENALVDGVNLILFAGTVNVTNDLTPTSFSMGLESWLAEKGVSIGSKLLLDVNQNGNAAFIVNGVPRLQSYPFWVLCGVKDLDRTHPITAGIEDVLMPWTNVINFKEEEKERWKTTVLATSSQTSFLQESDLPDVNPDYLNQMTQTPELANYPLSALLEDTTNATSGRIFLTANFNAIQDRFLELAPANIIFAQNMIEFASLGDRLIGIRSRGKTARPLDVFPKISDDSIETFAQFGVTPENFRDILKWSHVVGIPLLAVLVGLAYLVLYARRRRKLIAWLLQNELIKT